jgi:electron transfer flavoprotein beta subunit
VKIAVIIKQTPDTETVVKINDTGSEIVSAGVKYVMSPYCEFAVEEALRTKEKLGGEVVVVSLGPDRALETIRTALAMGCDRAIHLKDPAFEGGDAQATAKALAAALKTVGPDIVFAGKQAIDGDQSQVAVRVAELAGLSQATIVTALEIAADGKSAKATRRIEGGDEIVELKLPALISCEKGLNEPRYASLPGIMKAKKKEVKDLKPGDLGLDGQVGAAGARARRVKLLPLPERKAGRRIEAETPEAAAAELVRLLREEAKVL